MESKREKSVNQYINKYGLTQRELEILEFLPTGKKRNEIADLLNLSIHTVKTYFESAYRKLDVHNEAEAVAKLFNMYFFDDENTAD